MEHSLELCTHFSYKPAYFGGALELDFGLAGKYTENSDGTVTFTGRIAGGVSLNLIMVAGSAYLQGQLDVTAKLQGLPQFAGGAAKKIEKMTFIIGKTFKGELFPIAC